jgi:hypothetical protein
VFRGATLAVVGTGASTYGSAGHDRQLRLGRLSDMKLRIVVPLMTVVSLICGVAPVLADSAVSRTGLVGQFSVYEGVPDSNGDYCTYDPNKGNRLTRIGVRAPDIWARDTTSAEDSQLVGWRVIVKRQKPGTTTLTTFYRSQTQRDNATDVAPAPFRPAGYGEGTPGFMSFKVTVPREPGAGSQYWIFVRMFWYRHDGSVEGSVTHRLDDYMWVQFPPGNYDFGDTSCHTRLIFG